MYVLSWAEFESLFFYLKNQSTKRGRLLSSAQLRAWIFVVMQTFTVSIFA
jgi:hypothetical protein